MTLYKQKSFTVPATTPTKRPCKIHHMVKGQCLRCPHKVVKVEKAPASAKSDGR